MATWRLTSSLSELQDISPLECWPLVPFFEGKRLLADQVATAAGAITGGSDGRGPTSPPPLAVLLKPRKGAAFGADDATQVTLRLLDSTFTAFCCLYANSGQISSWCGEVSGTEGRVVGGVDRAALGGAAGPHLLEVTCRSSQSALEADLASSPVLVPDDASFFSFGVSL